LSMEVPWVWDPYNVTEDADLAIVMGRYGKKILPLDSFTMEESPDHVWHSGGASRQRQRWLKGYIQTGLVHSRQPVQTMRQMGAINYLAYMLTMFGTPAALLLNPLFWSLTIAYGITQSVAIQHLFPLTFYYIGFVVMVFGTLGFYVQSLMSCCREQDWKSVPYMFLVPFWWLFNSVVSYLMIGDLRPSTRYRWYKTDHGHSTEKEILVG
jgi:cellulose synthase/poly-beta-1,6-N-acetylglucosamine synthase-like glycosyltransferase